MRRALAILVLAAAAAGCATTDSRVVLRELQEVSSRVARPFTKVAVVTIESDAVRRKAWDDAFAARLSARGVVVTTRDSLLVGATLDADAVTVDGAAVIEAARRAGAEAIVFVQPPNENPITPGRGAYRWIDGRTDPDPRTDLDTTPVSVTEVRLYALDAASARWRAMVIVDFPRKGAADAGIVAESVAGGLAQRGFVGAAPR